MRRFLIILAAVFASSVIVYVAGYLVFGYALTQKDPYPAFMADFNVKGSHSYAQAERSFSDFVAGRFPIGSDATDAIAEMTNGGFRTMNSSGPMVELVWKRQAGPCSELYSVVVGSGADGRITKISGRLRPVCF